MAQRNLSRVRHDLLAWYKENRRDLPWRRTRDPYAIWIAEAMLQQTQVATVLPYYRRFLKTFPTVRALDRASRENVLALWSGLGYYRRAENLKKAARIIVQKHRGQMPRDFGALRALPGIGAYTAGALMSIAFNRPYPALDGNARRVLSRIFQVEGERELCAIGSELSSCGRPRELNQALMELGATVCAAERPACPVCPVRQSCAAWSSGRLPKKRPSATKRRIASVQWPLLVIQNSGKILLRRRAASGLLARLWELPGGERRKGEKLRAALARHVDGLARIVNDSSRVGEIRHSITYRRIRARVFVFSLSKEGLRPGPGWRWVSPSSLHRYPLSSLSLKAIKLVAQP